MEGICMCAIRPNFGGIVAILKSSEKMVCIAKNGS